MIGWTDATASAHGARRLVPRAFRGIRARLVATYVVAATVLAAAAALLLLSTLNHGLRDSIDNGLRAQVAVQIADLSATVGEGQHPAPAIAAPGSTGYRAALASGLDGFTATISPTGRLIEAQPSPLPRGALAGFDTTRPPSQPTFRTVTLAGTTLRVLVVPVHRPDGTWTVLAGAGLGPTRKVSAEIANVLWIATPTVIAAAGLGAWLLSGAALRPVSRMRADAEELGENDPAGRLREPGTGDSLDALARTFNGLLDRLHRSMGRQRALVADAGHELRTPLAVLRMELDTALKPGRSNEELVDAIEHAQVEVTRLATLAENLLLLAQADEAKQLIDPDPTDITEVARAAVRGVAEQARRDGVDVQIDTPPQLIAHADARAVRRILDNLLANAVRHSPSGGTITVHVGTVEPAAGSPAAARLAITDTGPGFAPEFLPHAFDRFTRSDSSRSRAAIHAGSGLGLSIVDTLARAHGGTATAANRPNGGASVAVFLPLDGPPMSPRRASEHHPPGYSPSRTRRRGHAFTQPGSTR